MVKRGRPKKSKIKNENIVLRVTSAEKAEITRAAERAGAGGTSAWVRQLALSAARG